MNGGGLLVDIVWWAVGGLTLIVIGLVFAVTTLSRRLRETQAALAQIAEQSAAQREQAQRDLMAMGQRVMEADKAVRRFSEKLDAAVSAPAAPTQYGQLEALLADVAARENGGKMSVAEEQLLSLLRRKGNT